MEHRSDASTDRVILLADSAFPRAAELRRGLVADGARVVLASDLIQSSRIDNAEKARRCVSSALDTCASEQMSRAWRALFLSVTGMRLAPSKQ